MTDDIKCYISNRIYGTNYPIPFWMERRDAIRRVAIKRQLRRAGVQFSKKAMFDIRALRALRAERMNGIEVGQG